MEFQGNVLKVLPVQKGVSQRTHEEWRIQQFVFEYFENETDRYSDKVVLEVRNSRIDELNLQVGDKLICGFGHGVDEYQGKLYNRVRAYKIEKIGSLNGADGKDNKPATAAQQQPQAQTQQPAQGQTAQEGEKQDDLPF